MEQRQRAGRTPRLQPASRAQLSLILDYMQDNEDFFKGKVTCAFTARDKKRHWETLADRLNSQGDTQGKCAEKWQRTWIDWRHSVKKKAKEIRKQKESGFQTKSLTPLEVRALALFRKLESGKFQIESDLADLDLPPVEQDESAGSETIQPIKIEDVLCISETSNTSSYDDFPSGTSRSSPSPRTVEFASSVTSKTGIKDTAKENVPTSRVINSVYVVSTKAAPTLAVKKATQGVGNASTANHQKSPKTSLLTKIKQEIIEELDISDNVAISESSPTHSSEKHTKKTPRYQSSENDEDDFESCPAPPKKRIEDTLGGLPLTLQNSILERLDSLNRNIETNTCALTILAKAVNDSTEANIRAVNHLAKSINNVGNMFGSYLELLRRKQED